jgi:hypothetical protein
MRKSIDMKEFDQSLLTQYSQNSTVEEIIDKLMIEEWNTFYIL